MSYLDDCQRAVNHRVRIHLERSTGEYSPFGLTFGELAEFGFERRDLGDRRFAVESSDGPVRTGLDIHLKSGHGLDPWSKR